MCRKPNKNVNVQDKILHYMRSQWKFSWRNHLKKDDALQKMSSLKSATKS